MAITGVLRPGHAQIRVLDLEEGFITTGTFSAWSRPAVTPRAGYFKAWDERDHNSLILREADSAGIDFFAFKVLDKATLDKLDRDLQEYGVKTSRIPPAICSKPVSACASRSRPGTRSSSTGRRPISARPKPIPTRRPGPTRRSTASPRSVSITACSMARISRRCRIFVNVLGFYLVEHVIMEDGKTDLGIWLSCSLKAHDIALVRHPEPGKLHHISFMLESWEKVLRAADIMSMNKVSVDITGRPATGSPAAPRSTPSIPPATASRPSVAATRAILTGSPSPGPGTRSAPASSITTVPSTSAS